MGHPVYTQSYPVKKCKQWHAKSICSSKLEHQTWFVRIFERDCSCKREIINKVATTMELSLSRARGVRVVHCHGSWGLTLSKMTVYCKTLTINETLQSYLSTIYLIITITVHLELVLYIVYYNVIKYARNNYKLLFKHLQNITIRIDSVCIRKDSVLRPHSPSPLTLLLYNSSCSAHVSEWWKDKLTNSTVSSTNRFKRIPQNPFSIRKHWLFESQKGGAQLFFKYLLIFHRS